MRRTHNFRFETLERRTLLAGHGDFNGDGFDDLAVGAPNETVGSVVRAGAVTVVYGSRRGLSDTGHQFWHQDVPGVNGVAAKDDAFGKTLGVGDFNGDGFSDLAIGVPGEEVDGQTNAGAVSVLYGSSIGLRAGSVDQLWTQGSRGVNDVAEMGDAFGGAALVAGDFNADGRDDLAIGVSAEDVGSLMNAGIVNVLYGSKSGLTATNDQVWSQNSSGINDSVEATDFFGFALVASDFNGDGRDDLAIGVTSEAIGDVEGAGAVSVIYGSSSGLTGSGDQFWHQNSAGVSDFAEENDSFGRALAAADFNGDGRDDLAIGVSFEDIGAFENAGLINLLYGSAAKLQSSGGSVELTAASLGFTLMTNAQFALHLAAADFDNNGRDDLAIGAHNETSAGQTAAGAVYVAYGTSDFGLTSTGAQRWDQDSTNILDTADLGDLFGSAVAVGNYNGDDYVDLAIGVPKENFNAGDDSGAVEVLYGFFVGLGNAGNQFWHQGLLSVTDGNELADQFGVTLG